MQATKDLFCRLRLFLRFFKSALLLMKVNTCAINVREVIHLSIMLAASPGFRNFVITEIDAKSSKLYNIRRSLRFFKKTADFKQIRAKTCHVTISRHTFSQSLLRFICVEHV